MTALSKWFEIAPRLPEVAEISYSRSDTVCPPRDLVFRALELVSPENVRVVILGQDPYHSKGKASGLSFGFHKDYKGKTHSSMANIMDELRAGGYKMEGFDKSLESWAEQGVLLLNTRLTVDEDHPMSHAKLGWELEILKILKFLSIFHDKNIMWMNWGAEARNMAGQVSDLTGPNVITTSHPCQYSNRAGPNPFTGSDCFRKCNEYLRSIGREPIKWT
jgi:uracil-DNA glycosylase